MVEDATVEADVVLEEIDVLLQMYEDDVERQMCNVAVVKPFFDKFQHSSYNNIPKTKQIYLMKRYIHKIRADSVEHYEKCHNVTVQSEHQFQKLLN